MNKQEVLQVLGKVGAVIADSHIVYTSGKHGRAYVNSVATISSSLARTFLSTQMTDVGKDVS